jgi:hypothetical protein
MVNGAERDSEKEGNFLGGSAQLPVVEGCHRQMVFWLEEIPDAGLKPSTFWSKSNVGKKWTESQPFTGINLTTAAKHTFAGLKSRFYPPDSECKKYKPIKRC